MTRKALKPYLITTKYILLPLSQRYSLFHNLFLNNNTLHPSSLQLHLLKFTATLPQGNFRKDVFFFHREFFSSLVMRRRYVSGSPNLSKRFQSVPFLWVNNREVKTHATTLYLNYISRALWSRKRRSQLINNVLDPRVRALFSLRSVLNANGKLFKTVVSFTRQAPKSIKFKPYSHCTNNFKNISFIIWARLFTALLCHISISRDPLVWPLTYYVWLLPWSKKIRCFGYNWFTRRVYHHKYTAIQQWHFKRSLILKDCCHDPKNLLLPLSNLGVVRTIPYWIRFFLVTGVALKVWSVLSFRLRQIFIHILIFAPQKTDCNFYTSLLDLARARSCYFKSLFMNYFFTLISQEKIIKSSNSSIAKYYFSSSSAIKIIPQFQFTLSSTAGLKGIQNASRTCNATAPTLFLQYSSILNSHYYSFFTSRLNSNIISFFTKPVANQSGGYSSSSTYLISSLYSVSSLRTSFRFGFIRDWWGFAKEVLERYRGAVSAPSRRSVRQSWRR